MLAKLNCKSQRFSWASDTHRVFLKLFSSSSVVLSLASPTGNTDIQMVSQQEVLSVNNLHSITTKSKISFGTGEAISDGLLMQKTHWAAGSTVSFFKEASLAREDVSRECLVNNIVLLTNINLLNLLHIPKNKIAATVQEKRHYIIRIWNQRIWSHFVQTGWVNLSDW